MKPIVYTVHAYRRGSRELHSYLVGVYSKKHPALKAAEAEEQWRAQKYVCEVIEWVVDSCQAGGQETTSPKVIKGLPSGTSIGF